jgi:AcrR family transcriptional regulator
MVLKTQEAKGSFHFVVHPNTPTGGHIPLRHYDGTMSTVDPRRSPTADRCLRADAERNRGRILDAARQVFAEEGLDAPMTEIARRADVGIATLYRRFPTREDLIEATFVAKMAAYAEAAEAALEADDPWTGFSDYVRAVCEMQAQDAGFADVLALAPHEAFQDERSRAYRAFVRLIRRAQDAGTLRSDFVSQDLVMVLMANAGLVRATHATTPDTWLRFVAYLLESFRAPGSGTLPAAPTPRQMYDALQRTAPPAL